MRHARETRDATFDGLFFFGVTTTGIFCRPSCPSRPKPEHVVYFRTVGEAVGTGYRACKRCRPEAARGEPPQWAAELMAKIEAEPGLRLKGAQLRAMGVAPEQARRWFQRNYGMTFSGWCRGMRLSGAFSQIRRGEKLDNVVFDTGYDSHSGFRDAFVKTFGAPPRQARAGECLRIAFLESPLGPLLAAASDEGVCLLDYPDRRGLEKLYADMRARFKLPVVPGMNAILERLKEELDAYFEGRLEAFSVQPVMRGSAFQITVWNTLRNIPFGHTTSYEELARRIGNPNAVRAVARANGSNRINLIIPCHRVIGKDGALCGYGGGLWRKSFLLEMERPKTTVKKTAMASLNNKDTSRPAERDLFPPMPERR